MSSSPAPKVTIEVDQAVLAAAGFTESGKRKFTETIQDYGESLFERSRARGEADSAKGMAPEVTHEHVRSAAHSLASYSLPVKSKLMIASQALEYVATAVAGVGGGHLDKKEGILAFALGSAIAVLLVVARLTQGRGE